MFLTVNCRYLYFFQIILILYIFKKHLIFNIWRFDTFSLLPKKFHDLLKSWNLGTGLSERESSLCKRVNLLSHVWTRKLLILKSKVFIFYYIMADTWCLWNMIILDFIGLSLQKKTLNSAYAKVSYLEL